MITVRQDGPHGVFRVYSDDEPLCVVETLHKNGGTGLRPWTGPDWEATRKRADHIAEAMRHYQASQEAETTP